MKSPTKPLMTNPPPSRERCFDCDTRPYWANSDETNSPARKWGSFIERGRAYRIDDPETPRPWLNYLCNEEFGAVVSNRGLGFTWIHSTLFRITKYDHPIDYLPRDFSEGRLFWLEEPGKPPVNLLRDGTDITCVHRPGVTEFAVKAGVLAIHIELFVPPDAPGEIWRVSIHNQGKSEMRFRIGFEQVWSIATFGIHTAEEGIPYTSVPGTAFSYEAEADFCQARSEEPALPFPVHTVFGSPGATKTTDLSKTR